LPFIDMASDNVNAVGLGSDVDSEVGKLVVELGFVTRDEVDHCRELQKQSSDPNQRSLADLLVENSFLTVNQAKRVKRQLEDRRGTQIPGYQLLNLAGKGAMAKVYKARQLSLDRIVAIKVLPRKMGENPDFVERFYREGRAAARLSHNNVVQAIDVGSTTDGYHYFVMEFVEGPTVYDVMQPPPKGQGRVFAETETLDIATQICDALAHAHRRGLIHRDVKPKNILLTERGVAKLTDLGLAREVDDRQAAESEAGKAYGTPYYISPEQIRGEIDIDFRADIYSLGATLYHMVTGRPPFDGDTPSAVMHRHLKEPLIPPDHLNTSISAGLSEIIEQAMQKDRRDRYPSTDELLEDLRAVQQGRAPTHARHHVDLASLGQLESTTETVDIEPSNKPKGPSIWEHPVVLGLVSIAAISLILNAVLVVLSL
jgi:serine/threonine-protein kinase